MRKQKKTKPANIEELIQTEWDIINDLKKMMINTTLSAPERVRTANALGYHATVLNKLLAQKGESAQFDEQSLGDFITNIEPDVKLTIAPVELRKAARCARRDFRHWTSRLSRIR